MELTKGARLGPYEVEAPLGAGGMGEVYRARDTRLARSVAIKILPAEFEHNAQLKLRFEREAKTISQLNHPNICTLYDVGDGYLVMEMLEGETLSDVLARGAVPARRAIGWAVQILRAMSATHAVGIIHRDLKPSNIFITNDGTAKVLDFGLAKFLDGHASFAEAPTLAHSAPGTIVGTIGYMSPEQVRGDTLDARSDIFSFAVVLYEMLTGKAPFTRGSAAETMSAILRDEPPRLESPPHPRVLAETLARCLEKAPDSRFHTAHDLALHLETIDLGSSGATSAFPAGSGFAPPLLQQVTFHSGNILHARFAPDGSIVYGASWGEREPELFLSHRGMPDSRSLGLKGSIHSISRNGELAVSLDRRSEVGFLSTGTLARVAIAGGAPRPIAKDVHEADWAPDGRQLAIARRWEQGYAVEYPIGHIIYKSSSWISHLRISPAGDRLAFLEHPFAGDNFGHVMMVDLAGNAQRMSEDLYVSWGLAWHPLSGEIWYSAAPANAEQGRTIMILGVDGSGKSREVYSTLGTVFLHDIAPDGTVLLSHEITRRRIVARIDGVDRDLSWFDWSFPMRLSRDGRTLLFEEQGTASGGRYTIYLRDTDGGPAIRLDELRGRDLSSDGTRVLALTNERPERLLVVPTGAGEIREIKVDGIDRFLSARYLAGEKEIVLIGARGDEPSRLWRVSADGGPPYPLSDDVFASWFFYATSPDGETVAGIGADQLPVLYPVHGDPGARPLRGGEVGDFPVHWPDLDHLFVCRRKEKRTDVVEIDLRSGERRMVRALVPPDLAGVHGVFPVHFADDAESYVFGYRLILSSLFVATGIR